MKNRYYVEIEHDGYDEKAYLQVFKFSLQLSKIDRDIKRIVCYIHTKRNIGYFNQIFDDGTIKKLLAGNVLVNPFQLPLTIQTKSTYSLNKYHNSNHDLVLAFGMDKEDLEVLDDYAGIEYIVAIPWLRDKTAPWIERWEAKEITGKENNKKVSHLSGIVKIAFTELSAVINKSTGITHPMDNGRAKTYIRALHKYEPELNADAVVSFLVTELGWTSAHANDVGNLISKLNEGRYFQGGDKTGLQNHYKRWKGKLK